MHIYFICQISSPEPGPEERPGAGGSAEDRAVHGGRRRRHTRGHLWPRRDGGRNELRRGRPRERDGGRLVGRRPQPGRKRRHAGEVPVIRIRTSNLISTRIPCRIIKLANYRAKLCEQHYLVMFCPPSQIAKIKR